MTRSGLIAVSLAAALLGASAVNAAPAAPAR